MLQTVVAAREPHKGRALDLGCGAGVYAVWLAQQGYQVTGIDFLEPALRLARQRADGKGVTLRLIQSDVLTWNAGGEQFDLILDSGCLHSLNLAERPAYRRNLLQWLTQDGDFVLVHFGKRNALDWRPIGPRRIPRADIVAEMAPELVEREYTDEIHHTPLPIGPTCLVGSYWFHRAGE